MIVGMADTGTSLHGIAKQLNASGEITRRGGQWSAMQVMRVLQAAKNDAFDVMLKAPPVGSAHEQAREAYGGTVDAINTATAASRTT